MGIADIETWLPRRAFGQGSFFRGNEDMHALKTSSIPWKNSMGIKLSSPFNTYWNSDHPSKLESIPGSFVRLCLSISAFPNFTVIYIYHIMSYSVILQSQIFIYILRSGRVGTASYNCFTTGVGMVLYIILSRSVCSWLCRSWYSQSVC